MSTKHLNKIIRKILIFLHISGRKRVFILTFQSGSNYGQMLQNFALSEKIKEFGYYPKTITWWFGYMKNPLGYSHDSLRGARKKYIFSTKPIFTDKDLKSVTKEGSKVIIGGDQVFRNCFAKSNLYMPTLRYYGDFVSGKKTLASYAASFGVDKFQGDEYLIQECKKLIKRFDKISVREKSGVDILKNTFGVSGIEVLDPVFLIPRSKYEHIITSTHSIDKSDGEGYIAYMCLDKPQIEEEFANRFKKERIVNIYFNAVGQFNTVEQWLYNIKQSKFVVTDSFHCTAFAIIFKKPVIVISVKSRGNARLDNIVDIFNIQNCRRESLSDIVADDFNIKIDWDKIDEIIKNRLIVSENFLKEVLEIKPTYKKPYINWPLKGIRVRYEKAFYYIQKAYEQEHLYKIKSQKALEYKFGLRHRLLRIIIKCLVDKSRYIELKKDHTLFFRNSKSQFIQFLGRFYN